MNLENPVYKLRDRNIFNIREQEYAAILENVRQILIPAEELGFEISECHIKDSRFSTGELARTIKQNLVIRLTKGTSQIDLSMQIPKLIDNNYIIINGRKKIPLFQLFDIPVVTRGNTIKIRTNVATMMVYEQKEPPYIWFSILGRKVPMMLVMFGYYGVSKMSDMFDLSTIPEPTTETIFDRFMYDMWSFYKVSKRTTQDDIIKEIGQYYSKYNAKGKGEDLIYAIDLILDTDIMSASFFKTNNLLEEIVLIIQGGSLDDTLITNKRLRCVEYMILSKVSKSVFDLCLSNRTARQPKFNVNSTQILSECNVSDIVQFDFAINPIDELTKLSRTSLVGPGGFNRQNVPEHLRDIMPSMLGRICPVDTPDRDNCGVLQNLIPNVPLDDKLQFTDEFLPKQPISIPVSIVPFLEHDDQTRLQMSSSQQRQAIMLQKFDAPLVQSGCEGLYTKNTQFVKIAKKDGQVVYIDQRYIILAYDDNTVDVFNVDYRKIYISNLDIINVYVDQDERVKAGQIIAESNFVTDGKINIGKNLLTAVMSYYGNNYEDGIVISDRIKKENVFTSVHFQDLSFTITPNKVLLSLSEDEYKPLPDDKDIIETGNPYAILKEIPSNQQDFKAIFKQPSEILSRNDLIITECNIYANAWNREIPEYKEWIDQKIQAQRDESEKLKVIIKEHLPKEEAVKFIKDQELNIYDNNGKFKMKGEKINGVHVEMYGIFFRPIKIGDKIGNRHGNKGVISAIVPHESMPQLEDGRHVDICINPLGIISRMNVGQLFELHMSMALTDLKKCLVNMIGHSASQDELKKVLMGFIAIIDKTEDNWYSTQFEAQLPKKIDPEYVNSLCVIQPPFESVNMVDMKKALRYTDTEFKYKVYEPRSGQTVLNELAVGFMYFFKMVHIAETRLAARGIGSYTRKTLQPLAGRKNRGGQRCGEMETACLIGHDAPQNLFEFQTTKSDCIDLKNAHIRNVIDTEVLRAEDEGDADITPESVKLLNAYFTTIGVKRNS